MHWAGSTAMLDVLAIVLYGHDVPDLQSSVASWLLIGLEAPKIENTVTEQGNLSICICIHYTSQLVNRSIRV
jgi:hypothetical protein